MSVIHIRGLGAADYRVRLDGGAWSDIEALDPGSYVPPDPPTPPDPEFAAWVAPFLTAPQGGTGAKVPDLADAEIVISRATGPAPLGVTFAVRFPDDDDQRIFTMLGTARWEFSVGNDAENYAFDYLRHAFAGDRAGSAHGPYCGHVYRSTGTHTWRVTLYYPGLAPRVIEGVATDRDGNPATTITVAAADTYFAGRTAVWSPTAASTAALKAAHPSLAGLDDALVFVAAEGDTLKSAINAVRGQAGLPWRLLIEAGTTTALSTAAALGINVGNLWIDRVGDGADPIIDVTGLDEQVARVFFCNANFGEVAFNNLDMRGPFDPTDPGAGPRPELSCSGIDAPAASNNDRIQINSCQIKGFHTNVQFNRTTSRGTIVYNCDLDRWYNYGLWPANQRGAVFAGLSICQPIGTKNAGRKLVSSSTTGVDSMTHMPAAGFTSQFDWALEVPRSGPTPRDNAPTIPAEETPPTTGDWSTVSAWWKANWASFRWASKNGAAFDHMDDDQYLKCAVHGPIRQGQPGVETAYQQIELRSMNGWSARAYNKNKAWDEQEENAFAIQACFRFITAWGSQTFDGETPVNPFPDHSHSMWRLQTMGGAPGIQMRPQRDDFYLYDAFTIGRGCLIDGWVGIEGSLPDYPGGTGGSITLCVGAVAVRNSLWWQPPGGRAFLPKERSVGFGVNINGTSKKAGYSSAPTDWPCVVYNHTAINQLDMPEDGNYRGYVQDPDDRRLYIWNLLPLNYGALQTISYTLPAVAGLGSQSPALGEIGAGHVPQAGSNALGAGIAPAPHFDAAGQTRPATAALGAFELIPDEPAEPVAQITSVDIQAQQPSGDVAAQIVGDDGTYSWVLVTTDPAVSAPSVAQVETGQDHTGAAAPASGSTALTNGVPAAIALPSGLNASYYLVMADGDSVVYDATPQAIDTTAPVLSGLSGTATGATTMTAAVTSTEAGGAIYFGVRPSASAALTAAQLVAGSGGAGVAWGSDATPTADGTNAASFSGLTAATAYRVDAVHVDAFGAESAVVSSAEVTTEAASGGPITYVGFSSGIGAANSTTAINLPVGTQAGDVAFVVTAHDWPNEMTIDTAGDDIFNNASLNTIDPGTQAKAIRVGSGQTTIDVSSLDEDQIAVAIAVFRNISDPIAVVSGPTSHAATSTLLVPPDQTATASGQLMLWMIVLDDVDRSALVEQTINDLSLSPPVIFAGRQWSGGAVGHSASAMIAYQITTGAGVIGPGGVLGGEMSAVNDGMSVVTIIVE